MNTFNGPDSVTTSLMPSQSTYVPQNLSAMPSITVQGPGGSTVPVSTYGGVSTMAAPSSNPLAPENSYSSPHVTTLGGQSHPLTGSVTRVSAVPYGSMAAPSSSPYQPLAASYTTSYGEPTSYHHHPGLPQGRVYQPPGTDYVPPGTVLRGGMHPIYDVSAVPTFEAPITFSTGNGPFPSLMSRAAAEEEALRQQMEQQQQQYQMQQQQLQQQQQMMMQSAGGGSPMQIGTRGLGDPQVGERINMRANNNRRSPPNANKQRRGCC